MSDLRRRWRRAEGQGKTPTSDDPASVASTVHRLAVLLQAGVAPVRAWQLVETSAGWTPAQLSGAQISAARDDVDLGVRLSALGGAWVEVASAWRVASTVGAPLADSLRGIARALRDAGEARDDVSVALAEPATTARLIGWLPVLAVMLVVAFGFDPSAMFAHPLGVASLIAGVSLMVAARRWTAVLVRRAQPEPGAAGWECDVLAIALSGGVSIDRALRVAREAGCVDVEKKTGDILSLSRESGAPAVELLKAEAVERRRVARTEGRLRAARLGGQLLLPLGVCTLPAFLLLGVGPMLLSVIATVPVSI